MQPRSSGDHPKSSGISLDQSGHESPPAVRKLSKQPNERKQKMKKTTAVHKPAPQRHSDSSAASPLSVGAGGASMHPILGFNVPHARRSYHREGMSNGKAADSGQAPLANGQSLPIGSSRGSPPKGRQRKAIPSSNGHFKMTGPLHRVPSDSSMTVSADSNA